MIFTLIVLAALAAFAGLVFVLITLFDPAKWQMFRSKRYRLDTEVTKYGNLESWTYTLYSMDVIAYKFKGPCYETKLDNGYSIDSFDLLLERVMRYLEDHTGHEYELKETKWSDVYELHRIEVDKDLEELLS